MYDTLCGTVPMHEEGSPMVLPEFIKIDAEHETFESDKERAAFIEEKFEDFLDEARDALVSVGVLDEGKPAYAGADVVRFS